LTLQSQFHQGTESVVASFSLVDIFAWHVFLRFIPQAQWRTEMFLLRYKGAQSGQALRIGMQILYQQKRASCRGHRTVHKGNEGHDVG
jgi:hypothetical protein